MQNCAACNCLTENPDLCGDCGDAVAMHYGDTAEDVARAAELDKAFNAYQPEAEYFAELYTVGELTHEDCRAIWQECEPEGPQNSAAYSVWYRLANDHGWL